jgi:hypothetical protein
MKNIIDFILSFGNGLILYAILFIVGSFILYHLARLKNQRTVFFSTLKMIQSVMGNKFGSRAEALVEIVVEGLEKIQDGNFTNDDAVDWFLRYVRLGASQKGITLSDEDLSTLHTLISSFIHVFIGYKPKQIQNAVNEFRAYNAIEAMKVN